jgi:hypothetical protein
LIAGNPDGKIEEQPHVILLLSDGDLMVRESADPWSNLQDGGLLAIRDTLEEAEREHERISATMPAHSLTSSESPYSAPVPCEPGAPTVAHYTRR